MSPSCWAAVPRVLRLAAEFADIAGFTGLGRTLLDGNMHAATGFSVAAVDEQVAQVRQCAGTRFSQLELHALVQRVEITSAGQSVAEEIAREASLSLADVLETPYVLVGSVEAIVEKLLAIPQRWGFSRFTVRWPEAAAFAPVVLRLHGQ